MPEPLDLQSLLAQLAAAPRVSRHEDVDAARIVEALLGVIDRERAHKTLCELVSTTGKLGIERVRSLCWLDSQVLPTLREIFGEVYEAQFSAVKRGLFWGKSNAEAHEIALQETLPYLRSLLSTLLMSHAAGLQNTANTEAELLREIVRLAGESGFPAQPLPPQNVPGTTLRRAGP